jgi:hypothetical protein
MLKNNEGEIQNGVLELQQGGVTGLKFVVICAISFIVCGMFVL